MSTTIRSRRSSRRAGCQVWRLCAGQPSGGGPRRSRPLPATSRDSPGRRRLPARCQQVVIVDEHDPARAQQPPKVGKIKEDGIESVVAVHDGEVEPAAFAHQARQCDLRVLGVMFHQAGDSGLVQELQAAAGEAGVLLGVDDDVAGMRGAAGEQSLADEQRRDPVAKADLDRADCGFPGSPRTGAPPLRRAPPPPGTGGERCHPSGPPPCRPEPGDQAPRESGRGRSRGHAALPVSRVRPGTAVCRSAPAPSSSGALKSATAVSTKLRCTLTPAAAPALTGTHPGYPGQRAPQRAGRRKTSRAVSRIN